MKDEVKQAHPDQKYINGLVAGDEAVIKEIYQLYYRPLERYVLKNKGTIADAQDLFNDSLKIIYLQGRDDLKLHRSFGGYLRTIYQRRWINQLKRRRKFAPDIEDQAEPPSDDNLLADLVDHERTLLFRKHFGRLPERCRQILELSFEGFNYREAAEKLSLNYSFVRRRAGECIQQLMHSIRKDPIFEELK